MNDNLLDCRRVRLSIRTKIFDQGMASIFEKVVLERLIRDLDELDEIDDEFDDSDEDGEDFDMSDDFDDENNFRQDSFDKVELITEAEYRDDGKRIEIRYEETELTGMEGSITCISFDRESPGIVSILRGGSVYTVMIFEEGKRHICAYETPVMPFELCIFTRRVQNNIGFDTGNSLDLDYLIEIRGAGTERSMFHMDVFPIEGQAIMESDEIIVYNPDFVN